MAKATTRVKAETKAYTILQDGWLNGQHRRKNSSLELTDAEAKYLVLSGHVAVKEEVGAEKAETKVAADPAETTTAKQKK